MNLILIEPSELGPSGEVEFSDGRAEHLRHVLRVVGGQSVRVGLVDGPCGVGLVASITDRVVNLRCTFEASVPERPLVDLLLALPRPKVLRRLWAQMAALGVGRIILTNAERVERNYFDTRVLAPAFYRPLLIEGLQQARDTRLPDVSVHRRFKVLVEDDLDALCGPNVRLFADPGAPRSLRRAAAEHAESRVLLAVGPEGGWNDYERRVLEGHGFVRIGIGGRTLRTDTACVAILALVHDAWDQHGRVC